MGKLGPRLSNRKKAKRWAKGQSSSSNPQSHKYRDQAQIGFFQQNFNDPALTIDILEKHNAIQAVQPTADNIMGENDSSCDATTFKTFDSFASNWSSCSNVSFKGFLNHFQSNSAMHKEMLAVLAAVTDVIKQNGGTESSTEYYAALMTTLETVDTEESISAVLSLLSMGMNTVPKNVLRMQFSETSQVFLQILTKYASEENFLILRHCIGCLSILLRNQEAAIWENSSTIHILNALLAFTVHSKPKVRKIAQHAIFSILKGNEIVNKNPLSIHPAAPQVAKHCISQLEAAGQPGQMTSTLHILTLLKDVAYQFPKFYLKSLCEQLLSIMSLNNILITSCCLQTLHGLFASKPNKLTLSSQLNAQIINALYDYQPAPGDTQPTLAWLAVMQEAYCNLSRHSIELCAANIPRLLEKCTELWLSDKTDVHTGATHTLTTLLEICIAPLCTSQQLVYQHKSILIKAINLIQQGMKYQFNSVWHHVLHLIALLFKIIGSACQAELIDVLVTLAELRDSYKFTYNAEIEFAVGAAVKSLGPEVVLSAIPLQTADNEFNLKRSWLLPVLKDCINCASLDFFISNLLPLAESCEKKSKILKEKNDAISAHSNDLLTSQIWALLPSFCNCSPDIKENFKKIAKILGTAISERKNIRLSVMAALRKLIKNSIDCNNQNDLEELAKYSKNYLPLLFNFYTVKPKGSEEEGQRLACYETIKVYLKVTNKDLIGELFDKALKNLIKTDESEFFKDSIFDLIRVLCQYTDLNKIQMLYEKCVPLFLDSKHSKEQKKAYRFLEEICACDNDTCQEFIRENRKSIQKVIMKSLPNVQKISKGARIRCITYLVKHHPQLEKTKFLRAIIPEVVMCIKELNEKCRTSSYTLLNTIAEKFLNNKENIEDYINMLIAGLTGTSTYCSASLLALSSITYHCNGSLGIPIIQNILELTCSLVINPTREIVLSALSFIKIYLSVIPTPSIAPMLQKIIQALINMADDCKRHFRQKVRDIMVKLIRKFGTDVITSMIPISDKTMHKRLKNIRKTEIKKQKLNDEKTKDDENDLEFSVKRKPISLEEILADSEEEYHDSDEEEDILTHKRKSKKKTWIRESGNIVDLTDPAAIQSISATKPHNNKSTTDKLTKKDSNFKTAPDGRLIIVDDDDDDDNESNQKIKNRRQNILFLNSELENENAKDTETLKLTKSTVLLQKKRKLNSSTNSIISDVQSSSSKCSVGISGIHRSLKKYKSEKGLGEEYRAKKAFGDIKRKGKPDPYVYIPLKRSTLNRRKQIKYFDSFKTLLSRSKKDKKLQKNSRNKKNIN